VNRRLQSPNSYLSLRTPIPYVHHILPLFLPSYCIARNACVRVHGGRINNRDKVIGDLAIIQIGTQPPDQSTIYHSVLANSDSLVMSSTGRDVLLNFINVKPLASVIVGSQPSGIRSSSRNGRSVSMSPPKWVNNVEPLRNILSTRHRKAASRLLTWNCRTFYG